MLMKHSKVKADGTYIEPPMAQLAFGALISGRVTMVSDSGNISKKALTIAIRYASIRRQFGGSSTEPETKILDYSIHQHRLMPLLAQAVRLSLSLSLCLFVRTDMYPSFCLVCHAFHWDGSQSNVRRVDDAA